MILSRLAKLVGPAKAAEMIVESGNHGMGEMVYFFATLISVEGNVDVITTRFGRYMISEGGRQFILHKSVEAGLKEEAEPYIVLDALALGRHLAMKAGIPLVENLSEQDRRSLAPWEIADV